MLTLGVRFIRLLSVSRNSLKEVDFSDLSTKILYGLNVTNTKILEKKEKAYAPVVNCKSLIILIFFFLFLLLLCLWDCNVVMYVGMFSLAIHHRNTPFDKPDLLSCGNLVPQTNYTPCIVIIPAFQEIIQNTQTERNVNWYNFLLYFTLFFHLLNVEHAVHICWDCCGYVDGCNEAYPMLMETVIAFYGDNHSIRGVHSLLTWNFDGWLLYVILVECRFPLFLWVFFHT